MKKLLKTLFLSLFVLIGFSCSEKKIEENKLPQIKSTPIESTCLIDQVLKRNDQYWIIYDVVKYEKLENLEISIQNEKVEMIEKQISDSSKIVMQTLNYDELGNHKFNNTVSIDKLQTLYSDSEFVRYKHIPFKIKIVDDQIISIEEIYIP